MLNKTLQSVKLADLKLAHISLALVGLMWVFPFLHYRHENPLTTFDQEWWATLLGVLALIPMAARDFWKHAEVPRIVQFPIALIVIVLLQLTLSKVAYFDQALLYILYLLFAALLMLLGAGLRASFGVDRVAVVLSFALLTGTELSALIAVLQHYQWHTPLDAVIVMQVSSGVYGNLAQPNHFADYIALGLASLGLLSQQRRLKSGYAILLAIPLLFAMTLSGSRSSWLYLLLMIFLAWRMSRREAAMRPLLRYSLLLLAGFGLMHLIVQLPFMAGAENSTNTVQRLLAYNGGGDTGGSVRLYLWHEAWLIFMQSPWLGTGFGQFAWHHFQLLPLLRASNISGLYNNAHNLIFQLAAEAGIAGLLALLASFGVWFYGLRRALPSAAHWWGYAALGVLAIHSLLEYPLWYSYFLAIASILLGTFDETSYRLAKPNFWRISLVPVLLLGLLTLVQLRGDYQLLKGTAAIHPESGDVAEANQLARKGLLAVQGGSLLSPYAEMLIISFAEVNDDKIKQKIALGANVIRFNPVAVVVYRQAFFLAQGGQLDMAERLLEQAIWSYPDNADARRLLQSLAEKDPAHFSALLEFFLEKEQEHARAVHQ